MNIHTASYIHHTPACVMQFMVDPTAPDHSHSLCMQETSVRSERATGPCSRGFTGRLYTSPPTHPMSGFRINRQLHGTRWRFRVIECFTTTFPHAHSWLNWVDEDDDEVGLKEKPDTSKILHRNKTRSTGSVGKELN